MKKATFLLFAIFITGCTIVGKSDENITTHEVLSGLAEIRGEYVWNRELKRHIYPKKMEIENLLASKDNVTVINILVDCLNNASVSKSVLNKKNVVPGVVCYEALSQTIYYEPILPNGDVALMWEGYILPDAGMVELKLARRAWSEVIDSKNTGFFNG